MPEEKKSNYFYELYNLNLKNEVVRKNDKDDLSYLPWAIAWRELKIKYPDATYKVHKFGDSQNPYLIDEKLGIMVETEVTANGITHEMQLCVMNSSNKAMKTEQYTYDTKFKKDVVVEAATMFDINTAIMRCLTKNIAMHGVGLFIYEKLEIPQSVKEVAALQAECMELIKKKSALSPEALTSVAAIAKEADKEANGDPRLIEDPDVLKDLVKKLNRVRKNG